MTREIRGTRRTTPATTLTSFEYAGLQGLRNLSDGHAYHEMPDALRGVIDELARWWHEAARTRVPELESRLRHAWAEAATAPSLHDFGHVRMCPTASNAIDIVGAAAKELRLRVGLVEPTFDNLALLLRRRGVPLVPVPVDELVAALVMGDVGLAVDAGAVDALLIVSPNNPTGTDYDADSLKALAEWCVEHDKVLILDNTFRFYRRAPYDDFKILRDSGVSFVAIEDSGKTWPTLDTKVSPLVFSSSLSALMNALYEEVYLCTSGLSLVLMSELLDQTVKEGLGPVVWDMIDHRRSRLRAALGTGPLTIAAEAEDSKISVEWIDCTATGMTDLQLTTYLRTQHDLHLLPGASFFWSGAGGRHRIRASLCRPGRQFDDAMDALSNAVGDLT